MVYEKPQTIKTDKNDLDIGSSLTGGMGKGKIFL